jgi:hypothetical protein
MDYQLPTETIQKNKRGEVEFENHLKKQGKTCEAVRAGRIKFL